MDERAQQLNFSLPNDAWQPAQPPKDTLFLIQRQGEFERFRPNITGSLAELRPEALLTDAADAVAQRLRVFDEQVRIVNREERMDGTPSVLQLVGFTVTIDGVPVDLAQLQTLVEVRETDGPRRSALCVALTAEADDIKGYGADYQTLLTSVRPT